MPKIYASKGSGVGDIGQNYNEPCGFPQHAAWNILAANEVSYIIPGYDASNQAETPILKTKIGCQVSVTFPTVSAGDELSMSFLVGGGTQSYGPSLPYTCLGGDDGNDIVVCFQVDSVAEGNQPLVQLLATSIPGAAPVGYKASNRDHWLTSSSNHDWDIHGELDLENNSATLSMPATTSPIDWTTGFRPTQMGILYTKTDFNAGEFHLRDSNGMIGTVVLPANPVTTPTWAIINVAGQVSDIVSFQWTFVNATIYALEFDTGFAMPSTFYSGFSEDTWFVEAQYGGFNGSNLEVDFSSFGNKAYTKGIWTLEDVYGLEIDLVATSSGGGTGGDGVLYLYDRSNAILDSATVTWQAGLQTVVLNNFGSDDLSHLHFEAIEAIISDIRITHI